MFSSANLRKKTYFRINKPIKITPFHCHLLTNFPDLVLNERLPKFWHPGLTYWECSKISAKSAVEVAEAVVILEHDRLKWLRTIWLRILKRSHRNFCYVKCTLSYYSYVQQMLPKYTDSKVLYVTYLKCFDLSWDRVVARTSHLSEKKIKENNETETPGIPHNICNINFVICPWEILFSMTSNFIIAG